MWMFCSMMNVGCYQNCSDMGKVMWVDRKGGGVGSLVVVWNQIMYFFNNS